MKENNNKIILYPSNWLYNAGVVGFLRVLEEIFNGKVVEYILESKEIIVDEIRERINLKDKKNISIHKVLWGYFKLFGLKVIQEKIKKEKKQENIKEWEEKKKELKDPSLESIKISWGTIFNRYFRGLFNANTKDILKKKGIKRLVEFVEKALNEINYSKNGVICSICGKKFGLDNEFLDFYTFSSRHVNDLGSSPTQKGMPNSFWNFNESSPICLCCTYFLLHYPFAFTQGADEEIFVNSPNFQLTWDLNKFAENILKREKEYTIRKLLGSSLLEWAIKRRTLLGAWTMMNIEVIVKREGIIDYFDLPYHITRILLDPEIASLIKNINEEKIFDLIVSGKFSELEKANYFVLRGIMKLKDKADKDKLSGDPVEKYFSDTTKQNLKKVSKLVPELYAKILKILNQTAGGL